MMNWSKINTLFFILTSVIANSQHLLSQSITPFQKIDFDSVAINGDYRLSIRLTSQNSEVVKGDVDLISIFGSNLELKQLFSRLEAGMQTFDKSKKKSNLYTDSIAYDFERMYNILLYKENKIQQQLDIWYDSDYRYLSPGMMLFVDCLANVCRFYNQQYNNHLFYQRGISFWYKKYFQMLENKQICYKDQWNKLMRERDQRNDAKVGELMALLFAQLLVNGTDDLYIADIITLVNREKISFKRLLYYISLLGKDNDKKKLTEWIFLNKEKISP